MAASFSLVAESTAWRLVHLHTLNAYAVHTQGAISHERELRRYTLPPVSGRKIDTHTAALVQQFELIYEWSLIDS